MTRHQGRPMRGTDETSRAGLTLRTQDFFKAYRKARSWSCPPQVSALAAFRFALWGDSGEFRSHRGWRTSRLYRC